MDGLMLKAEKIPRRRLGLIHDWGTKELGPSCDDFGIRDAADLL
jgi:hypothetical protein